MKKQIDLTLTKKQAIAWEGLRNNDTVELLFGGGAGCHAGDTEVLTGDGYKVISKIKHGDAIWSLNEKTKILELKKVLTTFQYGGRITRHKIVTIRYENSNTVRCTRDHRFYWKGNWVEIQELIKRKMAICEGFRKKVFSFEHGEACNSELEGKRKACGDDTSARQGRLYENDVKDQWKDRDGKGSQGDSSNMDKKPKGQAASEPSEYGHSGQQSGEFGMGNGQRELCSCSKGGQAKSVPKECRESGKPCYSVRCGCAQCDTDKGKSIRDSQEVFTTNIYKEDVSGRVRGESVHDQRCGAKKELEARQINFDDVVGVEFSETSEAVYDLEVEGNHNYIITRQNIVTHNSGKTRLGCMWLVFNCLNYSRTRWIMAREVLKRLKETTLVTLFEVCRLWGLKNGTDYTYNQQSGTVTFANGSVILLKELFAYPSDPEFEDLGSLEITGAFVDEISQVKKKAVDVLKTRCGRWLNDEYGIPPKIFMSCNPSKGWVYKSFYKPFRDGVLDKRKMFVQALVVDNPFIPESYIENLRNIEDKSLRERLLHGNWEYDDDPASLFEHDAIVDLFTNKAEINVNDKYISGDVSRKGRDKMVIGYWEGMQLKEVHVLPYEIKKNTVLSAKWIIDFAEKKGVRRSRIALDDDGVGGGVVDQVEGCIGFVNNSKPIKSKKQKRLEQKQKYMLNFANLKTQCYYKLAQLTNLGKVGIDSIDSSLAEEIIEELGAVKRENIDGEGKIRAGRKEKMKEILGHSPDFSDMMMIRMYFEFKKTISFKPIFL